MSRTASTDGDTTALIRRGDVLSEATQVLEESSKNTRRKILISLNVLVAFVIVAFVTASVATAGTLLDPARDAVVLPILFLINAASAVYNVRVLRGGVRARQRVDSVTRWLSIVIIQLASLVIVHFNLNTATSILMDHTLAIVTIFLTGLVLGRNAAIMWCLVTLASLGIAVNNRGVGFQYVLMTGAEIEALHRLPLADVAARAGAARAEGLEPLPISIYALVSVVFTGITVAATFFEAGLIGRVLAAVPVAVQKIQIATRERQHLEAENMRMGAELDVAQRLQAMILPRGEELRRHRGLEIAAHMIPASEIGGDIYDVLAGDDGSTCLVIGDVTDHGLASGVVMLMTQSALRTALEQTHGDLVGSLVRVNSVVYKNVQERMGDARNLTLALLHYHDGAVRLAGQHETIIVVRADGAIEEFETIDLGINVGLVPEVEDMMSERRFELAPGDLMVLYTDGVTEAEAPGGELYGVQRLKQQVHAHRALACEQIRERVFQDIRTFMAGGKILDDITLVLVRRTA
jgi:serine phosphatase RsbU (regulator of sigma subunit)